MLTFGQFWAIGINFLLIFYRVSFPASSRIFKNQAFFMLCCVSLVLFGIKTIDNGWRLLASSILILLFFNQFNYIDITFMLQWIYSSIGILFFLQCLRISKEDMEYLSRGFYIACITSSAWLIANYLGFEPLSLLGTIVEPGTHEPIRVVQISGPLQNSMISGALPACLLPFCFKKTRAWLVPFALWAVYISNSAMAFGSVMSIGLYYFWRKFGWKAAVILVFIGASLCYILIDPAFFASNNRLLVWKYSLGVLDFTLLGNGLGYYRAKFFIPTFKMTGEGFAHPHNELISIYSTLGFLGLAIVGGLIRKIKHNHKEFSACLIAFLVNSIGSFPFHISSLVCIIIISYGISIKEN